MLDTIIPNFAPQFPPDPRLYMTQLLERTAAYRVVPSRLLIRVAPDESNTVIAPSAAYEGRFTVPRGSRLWAISGSSAEAAGFDLQIRAGDTYQTLFGRRAFFGNATGQIGANDTPKSPLFFLPKPMLLMSESADAVAQLLVQMWNRANANNSVQVLLWMMTPEDGR